MYPHKKYMFKFHETDKQIPSTQWKKFIIYETNIPKYWSFTGCMLRATFVLNVIFFHGFYISAKGLINLMSFCGPIVEASCHCCCCYTVDNVNGGSKRAPFAAMANSAKLWQMIINNLMILSIIYSFAF